MLARAGHFDNVAHLNSDTKGPSSGRHPREILQLPRILSGETVRLVLRDHGHIFQRACFQAPARRFIVLVAERIHARAFTQRAIDYRSQDSSFLHERIRRGRATDERRS